MRRPSFDFSRLRNFSFRNIDFSRLSARQRKVLRIAGMVLLGIVTFLFTLHFTFPYDRVEGKLVEALSAKYDVTVGSTGHGWLPGTIVLENVKLRSRPTRPDEKTTEIVIDKVVVDLGLDFNLFAVIRKKLVLDIDAELGGGEVEAELDLSSSYVEATLETEGLPLGKIPGLASAVGLPVTGGLDADVELRLPGGKFRNAEGHIALACNDCTIGDGSSKISMSPPKVSSRRRTTRTAAGWGDEARSITVPKLQLGEFKAQVDISKGVGQIKELGATSKDGWFKITGKIEFRDPFASSLFPACMQFRLSDELKKREPTFGNIEYGISEKVRKPDGSFSIPTKGKLTELKFDPRQMCGGGSAEDEEAAGEGGVASSAGRPTLAPGLPTENGNEGTMPPGVPPAPEGGPQEGGPPPGGSGPPMGAGQDGGPLPGIPAEPPPPPEEPRPPNEDSREKDRDGEEARERDRDRDRDHERDDDSRGADEQRDEPRDSQGGVD
jgi:type II secretion system protein N